MYLTKKEESILDGNEGEMLSKLMKFVVELGDSFGAEKLIEIVSCHTVLNIGLSFCRAAADVLHRMAEAGLKVKVPTTADPIPDMDYTKELESVYSLFELHDQMMEDLSKIGVQGFTCTPYYIENTPNFGEHCAWSESSAVSLTSPKARLPKSIVSVVRLISIKLEILIFQYGAHSLYSSPSYALTLQI